jgi:hypothetical protein
MLPIGEKKSVEQLSAEAEMAAAFTCFFKVIVFVGMVALQAFVVMKLWNWFVPAPAISVVQSLGMIGLVNFVRCSPSLKGWNLFGFALVVLAIGWALSLGL